MMNEAMMNNFGTMEQRMDAQWQEQEKWHVEDVTMEDTLEQEEDGMSFSEWIVSMEPGVMKYAGIVGVIASVITSAMGVSLPLGMMESDSIVTTLVAILSFAFLIMRVAAFVVGRVGYWKGYVKQERAFDYKENKLELVLFGVASIGIPFVMPVLMVVGTVLCYNKGVTNGLSGKELWMDILTKYSVAVMVTAAIQLVMSVVMMFFWVIMAIVVFMLLSVTDRIGRFISFFS